MICSRLLDAGAPAEVLAEGHRAEAQRADAQAGAAERHVVVEGIGVSSVLFELVQSRVVQPSNLFNLELIGAQEAA